HKVVNGKREPMGEFDLTYDKAEGCWKGEFTSPRVKVVWRLSAAGRRLTGTARLLPGNETVRKVDARKQGRWKPDADLPQVVSFGRIPDCEYTARLGPDKSR